MLIVSTLYYKDDGYIAELCDAEAVLLNPNTEVEIYIEWPEDIVDLEIITKELWKNIASC